MAKNRAFGWRIIENDGAARQSCGMFPKVSNVGSPGHDSENDVPPQPDMRMNTASGLVNIKQGTAFPLIESDGRKFSSHPNIGRLTANAQRFAG